MMKAGLITGKKKKRKTAQEQENQIDSSWWTKIGQKLKTRKRTPTSQRGGLWHS